MQNVNFFFNATQSVRAKRRFLEQYKKGNNEKYNHFNLVKNIVTELNIPFIDIHKEVLEKEENPFKLFPFELSFHYNVEGYKRVSQAIYHLTKD